MTRLDMVLNFATALADRVSADIGEHGGLTSSQTVRTADELRMAISRYRKSLTYGAATEQECIDGLKAVRPTNADIAQAMRSCDWSGCSIGNKAILTVAADRLDDKDAAYDHWLWLRTMVSDEWQKIVKEYKLQPGGIDHTSPTETLAARIMSRIDTLRP